MTCIQYRKDIEMKECQAYEHVDISPQQEEQQDDVYEVVYEQ